MTDFMTSSTTPTGAPPPITAKRPRASRKREALVNTAIRLFNGEGYHAVGIDRILEEANVSKPTLYAHFKSKDELIVAALRRRDEETRIANYKKMMAHSDEPRTRLIFLFEILGNWVRSPDFNGCLFINASAEFARHDNPVHMAAAEHKRAFRNMIAEQATLAGALRPESLADRLMLLVDGMIVTCQVTANKDAIHVAQETALMLIDNELNRANAA